MAESERRSELKRSLLAGFLYGLAVGLGYYGFAYGLFLLLWK